MCLSPACGPASSTEVFTRAAYGAPAASWPDSPWMTHVWMCKRAFSAEPNRWIAIIAYYEQIQLHMDVNPGEPIVDRDDIHGDGVNMYESQLAALE